MLQQAVRVDSIGRPQILVERPANAHSHAELGNKTSSFETINKALIFCDLLRGH